MSEPVVDNINVKPTISPEDAQAFRDKVLDNSLVENAVKGNKVKYLRDFVEKTHKVWAKNITKDLQNKDEDPISYGRAMTEMNKLQCKILPTELAGAGEDTDPIQVIIKRD